MALKFDDIKQAFVQEVDGDKKCRDLYGKIRSGDASYATATKLAHQIGTDLAKVLVRYAPETSIDEWDLDDLLPKALGLDHHMVSEACRQVQEKINKDAGLGVKYKEPKFNSNRAYGLVDELKSGDISDVTGKLSEQIINFSDSVVDDAIYTNASTLSNAGVKAFITRTLVGNKSCEWCEEAQGTYDYWEVKGTNHPVWRRHLGCVCEIDFHIEKTGGGYRTERVNNYKKK